MCSGGLDDVIGVLAAHRLIAPLARGKAFSLADHVQPPVFVPETLSGMELLDHLRQATTDLVFVVDEYGEVQGLITERDVLEAITGEFGTPASDDAWAVQRDDGSWLLDGLIPVPELKDRLEIKELPDEDRGRYNTLAGMIMLLLGRLPQTTDSVDWDGWRFEVVDLDGKRVDKVLVTRAIEQPGEPSDQPEPAQKPVLIDSPAPPAQGRRADDRLVGRARLNSMFVASVEFGDACGEYPIVFVNAGNADDGKRQVAPIAVFGLRTKENLYVDGTSGAPTTCRRCCVPTRSASPRRRAAGDDGDRRDLVRLVAGAGPGAVRRRGPAHALAAGDPRPAREDRGRDPAHARVRRDAGRAELLTDMRFDATLPDGRRSPSTVFSPSTRRNSPRCPTPRWSSCTATACWPDPRTPDLDAAHAPAGGVARGAATALA